MYVVVGGRGLTDRASSKCMYGWIWRKGLIHLFVYPPIINPSIHVPIHPPTHPSSILHPSNHPSFHSFICWPVHPSPYASIIPTLPGGVWNVGALCSPKSGDEEQRVWEATQADISWLCFQFLYFPTLVFIPLSHPPIILAISESRAFLRFCAWQLTPSGDMIYELWSKICDMAWNWKPDFLGTHPGFYVY